MTSVHGTSESETDLAARFARETEPLFDVLMRGARRLARNTADQEELLPETLLQESTGCGTSQEDSKLKAELFRSLYNRWVSTCRSKQCRPLEVLADEITERDLAESAEAEALDMLPDSEIKAAMTALPESFRAVVYYADIQGYTYAETAAILNIPHGTVMSRASRGRQRLR